MRKFYLCLAAAVIVAELAQIVLRERRGMR